MFTPPLPPPPPSKKKKERFFLDLDSLSICPKKNTLTLNQVGKKSKSEKKIGRGVGEVCVVRASGACVCVCVGGVSGK